MDTVFKPIGTLRSPFPDKFGVPRQPGLLPSLICHLELPLPYGTRESLRGIEAFSHLWLITLFHLHLHKGWRPLVRPPRLGGNQKVGLWASRSPFRPNPISLSVARLRDIHYGQDGATLLLDGLDMVDNTPVLDIKPYVAYSDAIPDARSGFADDPPEASLEVRFEESARKQIDELSSRYPTLMALIIECLAADPRPAYQSSEDRTYHLRLWDLEITWRVDTYGAHILSIQRF